MLPPPALSNLLNQVGQSGLLAHWESLSVASKEQLTQQLNSLDWDQIAACRNLAATRRTTQAGVSPLDLSEACTPNCHRLDTATAATLRGQEALATGTVGAVLVAGGQGTRLGFDGPKGTFPIGPVSKATLFEILLGKLKAVQRRYGREVPLAIMTSTATDAATREFLHGNNFCGLNSDQIFIFCQGNLPAVAADTDRLLLDAPDHVAVAPDGHGGMLSGLATSGGLDWFKTRDCQTLVSFQVDNALAMPLHPEFLGHHLLTDAAFSTQIVPKLAPEERVGVVVEQAGVTQVVEYSDLPPALATERLADGRLRFFAGSIAIHAFSHQFLEQAAATNNSLPLHIAHKKVPYLDDTGQLVEPTTPNAYKFERFIFDLMPLAERVTVVEVDPAEGFAPLKNPAGASSDSPETVHRALVAHARRHLTDVGMTVADGIDVELDANTILDDDDLCYLVSENSLPGNRIDKPLLVRSG